MTKQNRPVGVIGTGLMGTACSKRLLGAGFDVLGYDVDAGKLRALETLGGRAARSIAEIARSCDKVVLAVFDPELPTVRGLMYNSRSLDRRLLAGLDRKVWDSTAAFVVARLSDSVIDAAVRKLPQVYYGLAGAMLSTTLKQRRDQLREFATRFYLRLAEHSEVYATREAETVYLAYLPDRGIELRIATTVDDREQPPWFVRRYLAAETESIDLHLGGGKDRIVVTGTPSGAIAVHVFDEKRREVSMDSLVNSSRDNSRR